MRGKTKSAARRGLRDEQGQAMVELALILPLLLILIFGVIDFARVFNYKDQATQVANETARWIIVNQLPNGNLSPSIGDYKAWAHNELVDTELKSAAPTANMKICFTDAAGVAKTTGIQAGDSVTVVVPGTLSPISFVSNKLGIPQFNFTGKATMRLELTPTNGSFGTGDSGC